MQPVFPNTSLKLRVYVLIKSNFSFVGFKSPKVHQPEYLLRQTEQYFHLFEPKTGHDNDWCNRGLIRQGKITI